METRAGIGTDGIHWVAQGTQRYESKDGVRWYFADRPKRVTVQAAQQFSDLIQWMAVTGRDTWEGDL